MIPARKVRANPAAVITETFENDRHEAGPRVTRAHAHERHWTKPAG